jgi:hypothetical protein
MVPLHTHIVVQSFWQHAQEDPTLFCLSLETRDFLLSFVKNLLLPFSFHLSIHSQNRQGGLDWETTEQTNPVWMVDFEMPVCKHYLLFISADTSQEKGKKEKKKFLPTGVLRSAAHIVHVELFFNCIWCT